MKERDDAAKSCFAALDKWTARVAKDWKKPCDPKLAAQKKLLGELDALATACRDLVKDFDLVFKLAARVVDAAEKDANAKEHEAWDGRAIGRLEKELDARRKEAVEQLKAAGYFERQAHWLLSRFPERGRCLTCQWSSCILRDRSSRLLSRWWLVLLVHRELPVVRMAHRAPLDTRVL